MSNPEGTTTPFARWTERAFATVSGTVGTFVAAYYASETLAKLSGTALWLPKEKRNATDVLIGLVGSAVFFMGRRLIAMRKLRVTAPMKLRKHRAKKRTRSMADDSRTIAEAKPDPPVEAELQKIRQEFVIARASVILFSSALSVLGIFIYLRTLCVVSWDTRDWLAGQSLQNALDAQADARRLALDAAAHPTIATQPATEPFSNLTLHKPEFVDTDQQQIYLPLWYPPGLKNYLMALGKANDSDGLTYMLAHEPDHLFDIIEKQAHWQVTVTNWLFLLLDTVIIILAAAGLAASFEIPAAAAELLGR